MGEDRPSKIDIQAVFKKLRAVHSNKICFDCGARNPTWSSVTYGVFICIDCSAAHRNLGVHITFVRSTQLDTNWTWLQLRAMQVGGNANATQFFKQHGCDKTDAQQKYKSRAASLYRDKLHHLAVQAMRLHGTKVHIEDSQLSPPPDESSVDFFEEHAANNDETDMHLPHNMSAASISEDAYITAHDTLGPKVEHLTGDHDEDVAKHDQGRSIIAKKSAPKKAAFGGKKGGMGARRLETDFSEIEQKAVDFDKEKEQSDKFVLARESLETEKSDTELPMKLSERLTVQDLNNKQKQLSKDPKKAAVVDRLGMAAPGRRGVSHSVGEGVKAIKQEGIRMKCPVKQRGNDTHDEDWEIITKNSYTDTNTKANDRRDDYSVEEDDFGKSTSEFFDSWDEEPSAEKTRGKDRYTARGQNTTTDTVQPDPVSTDKFANAKSISSDQYFGNVPTCDYETRANLSKFEGSTGIGSADLFGSGPAPAGASYGSQLPEMADIKDSVRQGVTKVAGRLSALGSSVSTYISERH